jgi:uncharacterized zinc-type alcohol dehydrogenase-like protein
MVPGHEIVGKVVQVGSHVKFKVGDLGTGCLVDSCRSCENCKESNFCIKGANGYIQH